MCRREQKGSPFSIDRIYFRWQENGKGNVNVNRKKIKREIEWNQPLDLSPTRWLSAALSAPLYDKWLCTLLVQHFGN